jgi:D-glycero-alpha-D-manno-heptose 1-phosphate guanylyltransferase
MQELPPAIVLAGGMGTRLRESVPGLPKPLAPVAGKPFLHWLLLRLEQQGVRRVVLATGYRSEVIRDSLGARFGTIALEYSEESRPLGTGGALRQAMVQVDAKDMFVLNGDTFADVDLSGMRDAHVAAATRVTLATVSVPDAGRYGTVRVVDGRIREFVAAGHPGPGLISAGVYLVSKSLWDGVSLAEFSFERDVLQARVTELAPLAYAAGSRFIDIGTPKDFARAQSFFVA